MVESGTLVHDVVHALGENDAELLVGELKVLDALADAGEPLCEGLALLHAVVACGNVMAHLETLRVAVVVVPSHLVLHPGVVVEEDKVLPVLVDHAVADALHRKDMEHIVHHLLSLKAPVGDLLQAAPLVGVSRDSELVLLPHILPQFAVARLAVGVVVVQPSTQLDSALVHETHSVIRDDILGAGTLRDVLAEP